MTNLYNNFTFHNLGDNILFRVSENDGITYREVDEKVAKFCNYLLSINVKKGDRVIQQNDKSIDAFCLYLAVIRIGAIYIPLNPSFTMDEVSYFIDDANPKILVCNSNLENQILKLIDAKNITLQVETIDQDNKGSIQQVVEYLNSQTTTLEVEEGDIACILYTSGTTGKPKGAMLSHKNLISNGLALVDTWNFTMHDVLFHALPIFHCHGLFFASHCVLMSGASMYFESKFDIECIKDKLPYSTVFMGVPTYYHRLIEDTAFSKAMAKNIRVFISGSAPLLPIDFLEFKNKTGHEILERYGMTETGINTSNLLHKVKIIGSVGVTLPHQYVKVVDDDNKEKINEIGSILVKGDNVFKGYWGKQDNLFFSDGYFITGDLGTIDENGYLYIVGRSKDLIISGGLNVYPKEVEIVIDNIDGVKESAVVGVPHADFGEVVIAVVVLEQNINISEEQIINSAKKTLANYKNPKKVIFIEELPRNTMGKVQKNLLRDKFKDIF